MVIRLSSRGTAKQEYPRLANRQAMPNILSQTAFAVRFDRQVARTSHSAENGPLHGVKNRIGLSLFEWPCTKFRMDEDVDKCKLTSRPCLGRASWRVVVGDAHHSATSTSYTRGWFIIQETTVERRKASLEAHPVQIVTTLDTNKCPPAGCHTMTSYKLASPRVRNNRIRIKSTQHSERSLRYNGKAAVSRQSAIANNFRSFTCWS